MGAEHASESFHVEVRPPPCLPARNTALELAEAALARHVREAKAKRRELGVERVRHGAEGAAEQPSAVFCDELTPVAEALVFFRRDLEQVLAGDAGKVDVFENLVE